MDILNQVNSLFENISDNRTLKLVVGLAVILYISCYSDRLSPKVRSLFDNTFVKVGVLGLIVYFSEKNFDLALLITLAYFSSSVCNHLPEFFTQADLADDNTFTNALRDRSSYEFDVPITDGSPTIYIKNDGSETTEQMVQKKCIRSSIIQKRCWR